MNVSAASLLTVQAHSLNRREHRARLIAHRRARSIALGPALFLQFEDELTVRWQIQELLRLERVAEPQALQAEVDTWSRLVPDGTHWKATLLVAPPDAAGRASRPAAPDEAVHAVWVQVGSRWRIVASANDDLPDRRAARPGGVHFLRFQLPETMRAALIDGASARVGCAHPAWACETELPPALLARLARDLTLPRKRCDTEPAAGAAGDGPFLPDLRTA